MCIIVYKPSDIAVPKNFTSILEKCFENNPDGAGMMYRRDGQIHIQKGYMKYKSFKKAFERLGFQKEDAFVCHFRIATQGNVDSHTCHPFPVSDKLGDLKATQFHGAFAFVHNGCIDLRDKDKTLSDSMLFARDVLSQIPVRSIYHDEAIQKLVELSSSGSRLLLWHVKEGVLMSGSWEKDEGVYYSNTTYKATPIWKHGFGHYDWTSAHDITRRQASQQKETVRLVDDTPDYRECQMCGMWYDADDCVEFRGDILCRDCYNDICYMDEQTANGGHYVY